ncbi:MAG: DUF4185 domain-containing protein, partial [Planctomycetota bacterium]
RSLAEELPWPSPDWPSTTAAAARLDAAKLDEARVYALSGDGSGLILFRGQAVMRWGDQAQRYDLKSTTNSIGATALGLAIADGTLYMLVRNVGNAQLAWSADHGKTWQWSAWKFTRGFGCPTFLNFGQNYVNAHDQYVYTYSHDADSAYERADRMVLVRVPRAQIREPAAYEYFARLDAGQPRWTRNVEDRGAVFTNPGQCYRSSLSYNAALQRYL